MGSELDAVLRLADEPEAIERATARLLGLLGIDTTVGADVARVRAQEGRVLGLIAEAVEQIQGSADGLERVPIDPCIEADAYFTPTHYTKTPERPDGLGAAETYRGRSNLVLRVPGQGLGGLAFNAHVDVVAPYVPPRAEGGVVFGRGACDDKGQVAAMLLALDLIEQARQGGLVPPADLLFEFVIDEESGGNGSLSLALDRRFAADAMVVLEPTDLTVHPANRGAVWYRLEIDGAGTVGSGVVPVAAAAVLALEEEGAAIKAESNHPLFPHRPVQTCHGVFGHWGEHASTVNDHVYLLVVPELGRVSSSRIEQIVADAVQAYCAVYGDKTKEMDPKTGRPRIERHYSLTVDHGAADIDVEGIAGHMGAAAQCDNAIIKAAYIIRAFEAAEDAGECVFSEAAERTVTAYFGPLVLEGGQGFVPTHSLDEVTARMRRAVTRAARAYCAESGLPYAPRLANMTFDKLHNDAYARDRDSPAVRAFVDAARAAGIAVAEPLRGWDVSCDARLFAREYPDAAVITFGAGRLEHAHSAEEQVRLDDIAAAAKTLARFALTWAPEVGSGKSERGSGK